jgi:RimJ/RimL family protein N-acetyltransferase
MENTMFIEGKQVSLRGLTLADLEGQYVNWLNDAEVCQYNIHHTFPYSREQAANYIEASYGQGDRLILAIILNKTGEHIGNIALQSIHPIHRAAEFGILIGEKQHWSKGYSKEAAFLIMRHGFEVLNLNRISCGTLAENVSMQRLASYLAMQPEGTFRQAEFHYGQYRDVLSYGVLRNEFYERFASELNTNKNLLVPS